MAIFPFSFIRKIDGKKIYAIDVNEVQTALEDISALPLMPTKRIVQITANPGATTTSVAGYLGPLTNGTITSADDADGAFHNLASGAVSGNTALWNHNATQFRRDWDVDWYARIKLPTTITTCRYWIGVFSGAPTGDDNPALHYAGFRYEPPTVDSTAFWRCVTDSGSAAPTVFTTTVAVTANTAYSFRIKLEASQVKFYINNVVAASLATTLPGLTTGLGWWVAVTTLTAAARDIKIGSVAWGHK